MYYVAKFYKGQTPMIILQTSNVEAAKTIASGYNMLENGIYGVLEDTLPFPDPNKE